MISWWTKNQIYVKSLTFLGWSEVILGTYLTAGGWLLLVWVSYNQAKLLKWILISLILVVVENCFLPCQLSQNENALLMIYYHGTLPRAENLKIHEHSLKYKITGKELNNSSWSIRSSRSQMFFKIGVLKI